jgi:hypothetical protein
MYTKNQKARLTQICNVLFPEYKKVKIGDSTVLFFKRTSNEFRRRWKLSLIELLQYQLPQKLALFKYGNATFLNVIVEDLIRCDINSQDRLEYFYKELVQIKFSDVHKQLEVDESDIHTYQRRVNPKKELLKDIVVSYSSKTKNPIKINLVDYAKIVGYDVISCFSLSIAFACYLILR